MILINILTLSWWLTHFTPYQEFLDKYIKPRIPRHLTYIKTALSCFMCHSFWITLGYTQDFLMATGAAMIAFTYDKIMNGIKTYI